MASNPQNHFILTLFLIVTIWTSGIVHSKQPPQSSLLERFEKWMANYGKVYKDISEKEKRFEIFKKNVEFIESFNSDGTKIYKLGINKFSDLTNEEFKANHNGFKRSHSGSPQTRSLFRYQNVNDLPDSVDWVQKGAVTPINDQEKCANSWAFSATAAIEGIHQITTGELVPLSAQMLVDCDDTSDGCSGGSTEAAFEYIIKNQGITTEEKYPYTESDGKCDTDKAASHDVQIKGYEYVPTSELDLQKAVANQPVPVHIDVTSNDFRYFKSGIFDGNCGNDLNHYVTVVGYGKTDDGIEYWLVKNSWGTDWAEDGYIRMKRNIDVEGGLCGIAMEALYPTV